MAIASSLARCAQTALFQQAGKRLLTGAAAQAASVASSSQSEPVIERVERDDLTNMLHVLWQDGYRGKYPYVWLRDNSPADHTYSLSKEMRARIMLYADLDPEIKPKQVDTAQDAVDIAWPDDKSTRYTSSWLRKRNLSDPKVVDRRNHVHLTSGRETWGKEELNKELIYFDFEKCLKDDGYFLECLQFFHRYGIGLFENVPQDNKQLKRLSDHIGYHYKTHYGDFFEVRVEPKPGNLTFTSNKLGLHTDHPYNEYMPGIQLLHCIRSAGVGGDSEFVDSFRAAEQLKKEQPDVYKLLCKTPLEYVDHGQERIDYHLVASRPILNLNAEGELDHVVWNNQMRSWFYNAPVEKIQDIYRAMTTFNNYLYREENMVLIKLQSGQLVWFDNLRVMHGRRQFEVTGTTDRYLQGGFFNWDALKSMIRTLEEKMTPEKIQVSI